MNTYKRRSILVIDSGVGGLSICQSILALQQDVRIVYFADDAYFPYGLMDSELLTERLHVIVSKMLKLHRPDLVVLACNTISTLVLPDLRAHFDVPFVGVVPAIKPAAIQSKTKKIGLLATPATIVRAYTDKLINDHAKGCEVLRVGSNELVLEAEALLAGGRVTKAVVDKVLAAFKPPNVGPAIDTIVLGCTHFPLLKAELSSALPGINWVDSGEAIAKRVINLLSDTRSGREVAEKDGLEKYVYLPHQIYFSKNKPDDTVFANALEVLGFSSHKLTLFCA